MRKALGIPALSLAMAILPAYAAQQRQAEKKSVNIPGIEAVHNNIAALLGPARVHTNLMPAGVCQPIPSGNRNTDVECTADDRSSKVAVYNNDHGETAFTHISPSQMRGCAVDNKGALIESSIGGDGAPTRFYGKKPPRNLNFQMISAAEGQIICNGLITDINRLLRSALENQKNQNQTG